MLELMDGWKFLAGLGIFLFGMFMMEESIKLLSGRSFKILIRRYTGTRIKGLVTGIVSTAILQSSSAVSLMVLAFVGAQLVTLVNAIAVIMGAKVGTTVTILLGAIGSAPAKKKAAVSSLLFSTGTATVILIFLPLIFWLILDVFVFADNPVLGVALFHTLFNVMGIIIFFPAIPFMANRFELLFVEKKFQISCTCLSCILPENTTSTGVTAAG